MEREGSIVRFTEEEQDTYNVPEVIEVPVALNTASAFDDAANKLESQADDILSISIDSDSQANFEATKLRNRASLLRTFSSRVFEAVFKDDTKPKR